VDELFSPCKESSETSRIDRGDLAPEDASDEMEEVLRLAEDTRQRTDGHFDLRFDPSGLVKGWAIWKAARMTAMRSKGTEPDSAETKPNLLPSNMGIIANADWIIDMGPEGGHRGGEVIFEGTPRELLKAKQSLTGRYLRQAAASAGAPAQSERCTRISIS
jgi:hypothetical protein